MKPIVAPTDMKHFSVINVRSEMSLVFLMKGTKETCVENSLQVFKLQNLVKGRMAINLLKERKGQLCAKILNRST